MDRADYMAEALTLARAAGRAGEVPVGCVVVRDGEIIGRGMNRRESGGGAAAHAEIEAITEACRNIGGWRLGGCSLYVTLEPCAMCAGAVINARIDEVIYGAKDPAAGACGSVINLFEEGFGHRPRVYGGIMAEECREALREFFKKIR